MLEVQVELERWYSETEREADIVLEHKTTLVKLFLHSWMPLTIYGGRITNGDTILERPSLKGSKIVQLYLC